MDRYSGRRFVIGGICVVVAFVFVAKLFVLQIMNPEYKQYADRNVLRRIVQYPSRGLIYDRNGKLIVYNQAAYDLVVIPREVKSFDTLEICSILEIQKQELVDGLKKAKDFSRYRPSILVSQISSMQYAILQERLFRFPGFFVQLRSLRQYEHKTGAHFLGYIGEVDAELVKKDSYYKPGDYIGKSGIERFYEKELRGRNGVSFYMVDVHNQIKGPYMNGKLDTLAQRGKNLTTSIDVGLQEYGEQLMRNKVGSVVAIEPSTGEILCLVSSPTYDPSLMIGRSLSKNYSKLVTDSLRPLFNRALMSQYPPGSIFKIAQGLIALNNNLVTWDTGFPCNKSLVHCHNHPAPNNMGLAVQYSCNPYFYQVFKRIIETGRYPNKFLDSEYGLDRWRSQMLNFGFGQKLGLDLPGEKKGSLPSSKLYNKLYGEHRWAFTTIYSLGIGQGEVMVVPVQMANLAATIANRGYYITPHVVKKIDNRSDMITQKFKRHDINIQKRYFEYMANAMQAVVADRGGTGGQARVDGITVCGKTGTAQNPHGDDHSVFICFAPKDNPKIAMAVYVENAGQGGEWAAPIAGLMIEKYLKDTIPTYRKAQEKKIMDANLLHRYIMQNFFRKKR
ncbi:MAG: penicillin-binding protein 2 [Bacteroidota bacterium]|nr:penicillin-binding protein 2 [Bacteroidota bacterium]